MNDDTISRQAAIDEIKNFKNGAEEWRNEQEDYSDIWHRADSAFASAIEIGLRIKKLPSAQPDIVEKILAAGKEGKEVRIYIGGRLFAVRELAQ